MTSQERVRCFGGDALMERYHDEEWGVPLTNPTTRRRDSPWRNHEKTLFEHLTLDSFQAGLSWRTILNKREAFRAAFKGFDPEVVAKFGARDIERLMGNAGIVRNRAKIEAAISNAQRYLAVSDEYGGFDQYIWQFTMYRVVRNPKGVTRGTMPATSAQSDAMAKDLKARGFKFTGSTICYAFMQAIGMVNDHLDECWRAPGPELAKAQAARPAILLLTTTGRKSGKTRTRPLPYLELGKGYGVFPTNAGRDFPPDWYLNLRKSPIVKLTLEGKTVEGAARHATAEETETLWTRQVARNPFYGELRKLAKREINVVMLEVE